MINGWLESDLSIVIQGPPAGLAGGQTRRLIEEIGSCCPSAELIFSTWCGQGGLAENLNCHVVESRDPGGVKVNLVQNNVDRQIVSSLAGVMKASRPYTVKLRSDLKLVQQKKFKAFLAKVLSSSAEDNTNRIALAGLPIADKNRRPPSNPIFVTDTTTLNPARLREGSSRQYLALCDWIYGGKTDDLHTLFSGPSFKSHVEAIRARNHSTQNLPNAEQWIVFQYLRQFFAPLDSIDSFDKKNLPILKQYHHAVMPIFFEMVPLKNMGLASTKYPPFYFSRDLVYSSREWRTLKKKSVSRRSTRSDVKVFLVHTLPRSLAKLLPNRVRKALRYSMSRRLWRTTN